MSKYERYITVAHTEDGKRIRKRIKANTMSEYNSLAAKVREEEEARLNSCTFGVYSKKWFDVYKANREERTKEYYQSALRKLSRFDHKYLADISRTDIQALITDNWEYPRTCQKLEGTLKQIFKAAIADGLIGKNPVSGIHLPVVTVDERRILTDEEIQIIKEAKLPPKERLFTDIELYLGLRPEETRALSKNSFDLDKGTVSITQAVTFVERKPLLKDTKNNKHRTIPMPDALTASVRAYNADLNGFYLFGGKQFTFPTKDEFKWFSKQIFSSIGIEELTWYSFRHTRGTQLYYLTQMPNGISTKLAAWYMGHSETMLINTYSHIDKNKENFDLLTQIF